MLSKDVLAEESFQKHYLKVTFYTGLPNCGVFSILFQFINGDLITHHSSMSPL